MLRQQPDEPAFAAKQMELDDRLSNLKFQLDVLDRSHDEYADLRSKVLEIWQRLSDKRLSVGGLEERQILRILCLNRTLGGATFAPTRRKPSDPLAKGLVSKDSRGDKTAIELFRSGIREGAGPLTKATKALATIRD